ncbi:MAG TPA: glycosyltransferase family 2 protein [Candidatus Saccharimonadales bacterium]|nr:glycosyltransferase family 2 protein [Candidatus Saccharimonadales bacterium]
MNISIVIPNYNGEKILTKNLPHVLASVKDYKKGKVEIIIPNDPSTDNSKEVISKFISSLHGTGVIGKTIDNTKKDESGFSKNVNRGVTLATGDILILLNSDVRPHKDFLAPLLANFSDDKVFAVGCMDESIEDGETILRGRGIAYWARGFLHHNAGALDKNNTFWVSGGSGAFRKKIWDKLGGLDPLYNPFYWEDIDLSYRALKSGYKLVFEKESRVVHEHEEGAIKSKFKPAHVQKIVFRNQLFFLWKNITDRRFLVAHVVWLPYHLIKAFGRRDWIFFKGFFLALLQMNRVKDSRYRAKKYFVRTDREILREFRD